MNLMSLRLLTWGTIVGSIVSALLLAAGESGVPQIDFRRATTTLRSSDGKLVLPAEPTAAGPRRGGPSSSGPSR